VYIISTEYELTWKCSPRYTHQTSFTTYMLLLLFELAMLSSTTFQMTNEDVL
jgi:hypothetical protein